MKYTVRRKLETYEIRDEEHHLAGSAEACVPDAGCLRKTRRAESVMK